MGISLDFGQEATNTDDADFAVLPDGEYTLRLVEMEVKKGKQAPYFNLKFAVGPEFKRFVWDMKSCSNHPYPRSELRDFLEALTEEDWSSDGMEIEPKELIGLVVNGIIGTDSYYSPKKGREVEKNVVLNYLPAADIEDDSSDVSFF